ncbi:MAG: prolipoprotein diacylglyceryl transferase, partial [Clostridia bacterium]
MHSTIGFPGLGLEFNFSRTAFSIFGINVQWYGIILTAGILVAFFLFYRRATKTEGIKEDDVLNVTLFTVPIAIIGARLFFVLTSLDKYTNFWDVFKIWKGGIAIYGAIIFGAATVYIYCRVKKIKALRLLDAISPAVMMGQIIGRWGNFINAEAYGWSAGVEKLPWRMTVGNVYIDDVIHPEIQFVHPTFLYESLWNLIGFIIIQIFYKHKKKDGQILLMYVGWYGLGRGLIELLRTDSLRVFGAKIFVILG